MPLSLAGNGAQSTKRGATRTGQRPAHSAHVLMNARADRQTPPTARHITSECARAVAGSSMTERPCGPPP
eukprot:3945934-Prymnesium_polylepis.1